MPTSWESILSNAQESTELNNNLRLVTNFITHDIEQETFHSRLRNNSNIAYLAMNNQRKVTVLHHFKELGGTAAAPEVELVCVVGLFSGVTVLAPNLANCFETTDEQTPNFTNMRGCNSVDELKNLRAHRGARLLFLPRLRGQNR